MRAVIPSHMNKKGGHYVPGMISGNTLYISGQLPFDHHAGKLADGDVAAHTRAALANVEAVLQEAGLSRDHVVQCRLYIPDVALWGQVDSIDQEFFGAHKPARVVVPTRELHFGALVEIEAIAELEEEK